MSKAARKLSLQEIAFRLLLALAAANAVTALNPVETYGYKFFDTVTGEEVVLKGIDYYPRPNMGALDYNSVDYFTEENRHIWERDLPYFQELGVNAVRLYSVDPYQNHDAFMCAMDAAGIYVIVELAADCPTCAITRDQAPDCYPDDLKIRGQAVITEFSKYDNTLAFSSGNEVNHFAPPSQPEWNAPCQKKFLRDMREYIASCETLRKVPVGLVAADSDREINALYYNCQSDPDDEYDYSEWYGLNSYVSCDGAVTSYKDALGFVQLAQDFERYGYSVPVVLTEFGCLSQTFATEDGYEGQRNFLQAEWMLTEPEVRDQFSGGFVFEYSMELQNTAGYPFKKYGQGNYGVGYFSPTDCDDVDRPCEYNTVPSFYNLKRAYKTNATAVTKDSFTISEDRTGRSTCPWNFPSIASYKWKADKVRGLICPSSEAKHFQCPADLDELRGRTELNHFTEKKGFHLPGVVLLYVAVTVVAVFMAMLAFSKERDDDDDEAGRSWSVVLSKNFYRRKEGYGSDESTGLLSMKGVGQSTPYMAIESDSSQDEA